MSLCITTLTPSGIILTADSRQTYRNNAGMTRIGTDNAVKLFQLSKKVAVVIAGRAFFPDSKGVFKETGWFINEFKKTVLDGKDVPAVKDIANKLNSYLVHNFIEPEEVRIKLHLEAEIKKEGGTNITFNPRHEITISYSFTKDGNRIDRTFIIETISFIVAGYDADGIGRAYYCLAPVDPTDPVSRNTEVGGFLRIGQDDIVTRIINGWAPEIQNMPFVKKAQSDGVNIYEELGKVCHIINWGVMTLQDSVDFCVLMTRITESVQRFSDGTHMSPGGITGVGGAIDVAKITPDSDFEWIRKKELVVDDS